MTSTHLPSALIDSRGYTRGTLLRLSARIARRARRNQPRMISRAQNNAEANSDNTAPPHHHQPRSARPPNQRFWTGAR